MAIKRTDFFLSLYKRTVAVKDCNGVVNWSQKMETKGHNTVKK